MSANNKKGRVVASLPSNKLEGQTATLCRIQRKFCTARDEARVSPADSEKVYGIGAFNLVSNNMIVSIIPIDVLSLNIDIESKERATERSCTSMDGFLSSPAYRPWSSSRTSKQEQRYSDVRDERRSESKPNQAAPRSLAPFS